MSNQRPALGETITLQFSLTANASDALRTGLYVLTDGVGEFSVLEPTAMRLESPTQILHSQPKDLASGKAGFQLAWKAPATPGVAQFTAWSITGNTNGMPIDDNYASLPFQVAFGCDALYYYPDQDKDGFGDLKKPKLACTPPADLLLIGGDCDDRDVLVSPGGVETCNVIDDNCDGTRDEGLGCGLVYPDADGDGYGSPTGQSMYGASGNGFSLKNTDCNDTDPSISPGAPETPNGRDDNCNAQVDEAASPAPVPTTGQAGSASIPMGVNERATSSGACAVSPAKSSMPSVAWLALALLVLRAASRRSRNPFG